MCQKLKPAGETFSTPDFSSKSRFRRSSEVRSQNIFAVDVFLFVMNKIASPRPQEIMSNYIYIKTR